MKQLLTANGSWCEVEYLKPSSGTGTVFLDDDGFLMSVLLVSLTLLLN
jgi:hypothetical protein